MKSQTQTQTVLLTLLVVMASSCLLLFGQSEGSGTARAKSKEPALVLKGLDPVALTRGEKKPGQKSHTLVHQGYRYLFASADNRSAFQSNPEKYAVQDYGNCPVARVMMNREMKGKPELFSVHQGKVYLFAMPEAVQMFKENPEKFVQSHREGSGQ